MIATKSLSHLALGFGILCWLTPAMARPQFVNLVPTPFQCETCHDDARNRQFRNGFGIDFATQRTVWFSDANPEDCPTDCTTVEECPRECAGVCPRDSDGDGLSNGRELGDPDCTWRPGDRRPDFEATMPGDPRDPDRCGDGVVDPGEDCDGEDLGDEDCGDHGFLEGPLGCTANCEYDDQICEEIPEPDAAIPDAAMPDAAMPDAAMPDAAIPDFGGPDAALPDFGGPDAAATDSGGLDTGGDIDAEAPSDAGTAEDGSVLNARMEDTGPDANHDRDAAPEPDSGGCRVALGDPGSSSAMGLFLVLFGLFGRLRKA